MNKDRIVRMETSEGMIVLKLYRDTPGHQDNFLKLVEEGTLNGTLFHRVIKNFMIQGGDPESKNAPRGKMLGSGDLGYTLPAEFVYPEYFHKKGALSAARLGDNANPTKASSACQFYIVTGKVYSKSTLLNFEKKHRENAFTDAFNTLAQQHLKDILLLRKANDRRGLEQMEEQLDAQAKAMVANQTDFHFTAEQMEAYTTVGGTPHLDAEYTVFGEVVSGMEIVEKIQEMPTDRNDRPLTDVKILKLTAVDED